MGINPDDIADTVEMMDELSHWLYERREKMDIRKMAFMLVVKAGELITTYDLDDPILLIEKGLELGHEYGLERREK